MSFISITRKDLCRRIMDASTKFTNIIRYGNVINFVPIKVSTSILSIL